MLIFQTYNLILSHISTITPSLFVDQREGGPLVCMTKVTHAFKISTETEKPSTAPTARPPVHSERLMVLTRRRGREQADTASDDDSKRQRLSPRAGDSSPLLGLTGYSQLAPCQVQVSATAPLNKCHTEPHRTQRAREAERNKQTMTENAEKQAECLGTHTAAI